MIRYFVRTLFSHFKEGRSLYLLSVFGVALGVASVVCIQIINMNALGAFQGGIKAISGDADFSILGRTPVLAERVYPKVLAEAGVAAAWPIYRIDVALRGREDFFLEVVGFDFFAPVDLPWDRGFADPSEALGRSGWVAVTPRLAGEMGWKIGDSLEVSSGSRTARLTVGALVDFHKVSPLASRKLVVMDIAQAQSLLGMPGEIHQIDVKAGEDTELDDLILRLKTKLGPSVQILTPEQRQHQAAGLLGAFRLNLTALSLISLFVAAFLIYSSTQAALIRRRTEFGLLRSTGATREQVFGLIIGEVILLAIVGVGLGLPLGTWVAAANVEVVSGTLTNLYVMDEIESLRVSPWIYLMAALIGIGAASAGAVFPALDISRRDTRTLLAPFTLHEKVRSAAFGLFVSGWALVGVLCVWFWFFGKTWKPGGFVLGTGVFLGTPMITPFLIHRICGPIRVRGFGFGYSLKSMGIRLQTTAFAVSALAVAVSMLIGITLMIGSFRRTVEVWIGTTVQADIYITTESWMRAGREATLHPDLASALSAHPGVMAVDRLRQFFAYSGDRRIFLGGVEMGLPGEEVRFPLLSGNRDDAFRMMREEGAVLISEPLSRKAGLGVGDRLPVYGPQGEIFFPISGIYYDYSTEGGAAAMDIRTMSERFGPGLINNMALYLDPDRDPERIVDELKYRFADFPLQIRSNRRLREEIFAIFDQTFAVTQILRGMSLLIAICGITLNLLVVARERISELALYRAIGAGRRQIFGVFVGEGIGMALMSLFLGLLGGIALAMILIFVINPAYFGWTIQVHWTWGPILQQSAMIMAAAILASLYPALRASQVPAKELSKES